MKYQDARIKLKNLLEFCERTFSKSEFEKAKKQADEIVIILPQLKKEWQVEEYIKSDRFQKRLKDLLNERFSIVVDKNVVVVRVYGVGEEFEVPKFLKEIFSGNSITSTKIKISNQFSTSAYRRKHFQNSNNTVTIEIEIDIEEFLKKENIQ